MLPARLLTSIGIYLQSAAHLELAIWQIVMLAEGIDETSNDQLIQTLEFKKITQKLISRLRKCSRKCHAPVGLRIHLLANKIADGVENRNLAAHGAFFIDDKTDGIRVAHYFPRGKGNDRRWFEYQEAISERAIRVALEEIDQLLREAVEIRSVLESKRRVGANPP